MKKMSETIEYRTPFRDIITTINNCLYNIDPSSQNNVDKYDEIQLANVIFAEGFFSYLNGFQMKSDSQTHANHEFKQTLFARYVELGGVPGSIEFLHNLPEYRAGVRIAISACTAVTS